MDAARAVGPGLVSPQPGVSVVITAHNAAESLPATVLAVARQRDGSEREIDVVVVDDRSSDETSARIESLRLPNVRLLRIDTVPSPGTCTARQHALDVAVRATRTPYVLLLDADATPPRGWVSSATRALHEAAAVASGVAFSATSRTWSARVLAALQTVDAGYYLQWCRVLARTGAPSGMLFGAAGFRRELYDRIGGFCALGFTLLEDLAFARALHALDAKLEYVAGEPVVVHACARWRDMLSRALRTGTAGGRSLLATTLGLWGLSLPALGVAAVIAGGAWWIVLLLRYLAGVGFAASALRRLRRLRLLPAALMYEPTALLMALLVAATAFRVREIEWGGMRYPRRGPFFAPRA